ncbi:MAG TPA: HDOD domain-containing protein [Ignavibacteriaceae bacterium]|jgi:HD-like signal output (HDOD) protein|nr:HDOD domain-containing protein [Ignavibacteriaceae bacterium]
MMTFTMTVQKKKEKTELVLRNIYNLPPIPDAIKQSLEMLDRPELNSHSLSNIISKDQGLVTKILTIANSPLYGLQRKVTTVEFAILVLGYSELRNIISVLSIVEAFKNKTDAFLNQKEFWLHSFLTGSASKRLAEDFDFPNSGEAFIAGFLHDFGFSIIHRFFHADFIEIYKLVNEKGVSYNDAELEVLGMTHQQIGNYLADKWNFPETLCEAILFHHNPEESKQNKILASIVHLADYMTEKLDIGNSYWDKNLVLSDSELGVLRFREHEQVDKFIESYRELFSEQVDTVRFVN